ncbi:hypothetical protein IFM89_004399 [Coptis chinensis]|uniref:Quinolinate phosphoribosyl transferase N-terminal domain-containing protein n=1 Tax=Coptis chinensis TaxID=261450 RepID=A0A835IJQ4_9MAGN|nr:hypothetical protein IFM89_004399 [Coptis chinensis]
MVSNVISNGRWSKVCMFQKEVKLLGRSVEKLESTVDVLACKMDEWVTREPVISAISVRKDHQAGNIKVFCRCRPLNSEEIAIGASMAIAFELAKDGELMVTANGASKKVYKFDSVFSPQADQGNGKSITILVYHFNALIKLALSEDADDRGDITCLATVPIDMEVEAHFFAKVDDIIAGISLAEMIFNEVEWFKKDGDSVSKGTQFGKVSGKGPASTKDAPQVESSIAKRSALERGDILIDINDRFSRYFLSDIFSKERLTEDSSSISPLYSDGTGLSMNMENLDLKHWSFFQKLAQDELVRNDVSLMDQDHIGYSSPLTKVDEGSPGAYNFSQLMTDVNRFLDSQFFLVGNSVGTICTEEIQQEPSVSVLEYIEKV